eukprot:scaffold71475_cov67-Phaeocystis_antarctica.AAC.7
MMPPGAPPTARTPRPQPEPPAVAPARTLSRSRSLTLTLTLTPIRLLPRVRGRPLLHPPVAAGDQVLPLAQLAHRPAEAAREDLAPAVRRAHPHRLHLLLLWHVRQAHQLHADLRQHPALLQLGLAPGAQAQGLLLQRRVRGRAWHGQGRALSRAGHVSFIVHSSCRCL